MRASTLGVDYVDLYQIHWADPAVPFAETAGALQELVDQGKIRYVGVSNFDVDQIAEFGRTHRVETLQPPYHLFRRDRHASCCPSVPSTTSASFLYGPLAHGLLSGRLDRTATFAPDDWRSRSPVFHGLPFVHNLDVVRALQLIADELGATVSQLAIAWVLEHPAVDVADRRYDEHRACYRRGRGGGPGALEGHRSLIDAVIALRSAVGGPSPEAMP